MVIKRIRRIKAKAITDIVDQDGPYFEVSNYDVKKKLDELVDSMNKITEYLAKAELQKCDHLHGVEELIVIDPEIPVNEDGHDEACSSGIGMDCDCWANPEVRKASKEAMAKMRDTENDYCSVCGCMYDDKQKGMQGRNQFCKCTACNGHKSK